MALRIPAAQLSNDTSQRKPLVENSRAIMEAVGNNPYANAINQINPVIANALQKRQQLRKQAREAAIISDALEKGIVPKGINDTSKLLDIYKAQTDREKIKPAQNTRSVFVSDFKKNPQPYLEFQQSGGKLQFINDLSEGNRNANLDARKDTIVLNWASKMRNDPAIKPLYQQKINAGYVEKIIRAAKEGNTVAGAALAAKMARTMGEVGVLTDNDIKRYVTSGRLDRNAADKLSLMINGKSTDATLDEVSQIASILSSTFEEQVQPTYNWYSEVLANTTGDTPENSARLLGVSYFSNDNNSTPMKVNPQLDVTQSSGIKIKSVTQVGGK